MPEIEIPNKETSKDSTYLIFCKQELLEFSICSVPANPLALVKALSLAKTIEMEKMETTEELGSSLFWSGLINNFER